MSWPLASRTANLWSSLDIRDQWHLLSIVQIPCLPQCTWQRCANPQQSCTRKEMKNRLRECLQLPALTLSAKEMHTWIKDEMSKECLNYCARMDRRLNILTEKCYTSLIFKFCQIFLVIVRIYFIYCVCINSTHVLLLFFLYGLSLIGRHPHTLRQSTAHAIRCENSKGGC